MIVVCDLNPVRYVRHPWVRTALMVGCVVVTLAVLTGALPHQPVVLTALSHRDPAMLGYVLMHANLWHLGGNLLALWVFADNVEDAMGHARFALFVVLAALAAAVAQFLMEPATDGLLGASGVAAGTMGAYLLLHPRAHVAVWMRPLWPPVPVFFPAGLVVGAWFLLNVGNAVFGGDALVAWWGHIGGFLAGVVLVALLRRRDVPLLQRPQSAEMLLPGLSFPARHLLRLSDTARDERHALEGIVTRSFWRNLVAFLVLMVLGEIVVRLAFIP